MLFFCFIHAAANIKQTLENFLNQKQTIHKNVEISVYRKNKPPQIKPGSFYWEKKAQTTRCEITQEQEKRILDCNNGKLFLHTIIPNSRDKIRPKNLTNSPLMAFFRPKVSLDSTGHFRYLIEEVSKDNYLLTIHEWHDKKTQKQRVKIVFNKNEKGQIQFQEWRMILKDQTTIMKF